MAEVPGFHATHCPACGKRYRPGEVIMGWQPCDCPGAGPAGGHITAWCRDDTGGCGHVLAEGHVGPAPAPDRMPNFGQA